MPPIPLTFLSLSVIGSEYRVAVAESIEIPPLPVSRIKLRVSVWSSKSAFTTTMPPFSCRNEKLLISFARFVPF